MKVEAMLDKAQYQAGEKISNEEMANLNLVWPLRV